MLETPRETSPLGRASLGDSEEEEVKLWQKNGPSLASFWKINGSPRKQKEVSVCVPDESQVFMRTAVPEKRAHFESEVGKKCS